MRDWANSLQDFFALRGASPYFLEKSINQCADRNVQNILIEFDKGNSSPLRGIAQDNHFDSFPKDELALLRVLTQIPIIMKIPNSLNYSAEQNQILFNQIHECHHFLSDHSTLLPATASVWRCLGQLCVSLDRFQAAMEYFDISSTLFLTSFAQYKRAIYAFNFIYPQMMMFNFCLFVEDYAKAEETLDPILPVAQWAVQNNGLYEGNIKFVDPGLTKIIIKASDFYALKDKDKSILFRALSAIYAG